MPQRATGTMSLSSEPIALVSIAAQRANQLLDDPPERRVAIPVTDRRKIVGRRMPKTIAEA
jgi:hypothetical protein